MIVSSGWGIARQEAVMIDERAGDGESPIGAPAGIGGGELRFAVLLHAGYGMEHYDFLLEVQGKERLMAWHVKLPPERWAGATLAELGAERIGEHRKEYMVFEG